MHFTDDTTRFSFQRNVGILLVASFLMTGCGGYWGPGDVTFTPSTAEYVEYQAAPELPKVINKYDNSNFLKAAIHDYWITGRQYYNFRKSENTHGNNSQNDKYAQYYHEAKKESHEALSKKGYVRIGNIKIHMIRDESMSHGPFARLTDDAESQSRAMGLIEFDPHHELKKSASCSKCQKRPITHQIERALAEEAQEYGGEIVLIIAQPWIIFSYQELEKCIGERQVPTGYCFGATAHERKFTGDVSVIQGASVWRQGPL